MPHPRPSSKTSDTQKRITNVIDHTNLDDFFSQPSLHELTATSERRVQEVIEDLKRQTVEELKNWSWSPSDDKKFKAFKFFDDSTEKTSIISDRDMVSFPVSLPTVSSSSSTESNCPAAISIEPKIQSYTKSGRSTYTRCGASSSSPQDQLLRTSDGRHESRRPTTKPSNLTDLDNTSSRPSNVRSRAKIPLPSRSLPGTSHVNAQEPHLKTRGPHHSRRRSHLQRPVRHYSTLHSMSGCSRQVVPYHQHQRDSRSQTGKHSICS